MYHYTYVIDPSSLNDILYRYYLEVWLIENCTDWSLEEQNNTYTVTFNNDEDLVHYILSPVSGYYTH